MILKKLEKEVSETNNKKLLGEALSSFGQVYRGLGRFDEAVDSLNKALEIKEYVGDLDSKANTYFKLGQCFFGKEEYRESIKNFSKSYDIACKSKTNQGTAVLSLCHVGTAYRHLFEIEASEEAFKKALSLVKVIPDYRVIVGSLIKDQIGLIRFNEMIKELNP